MSRMKGKLHPTINRGGGVHHWKKIGNSVGRKESFTTVNRFYEFTLTPVCRVAKESDKNRIDFCPIWPICPPISSAFKPPPPPPPPP